MNREELKSTAFEALRFNTVTFILFSAVGIYCLLHTHISSFSPLNELYTLFLFCGLPGCLSLLQSAVIFLIGLISRKAMRITGVVLSSLSLFYLLLDALVLTQYKIHIDTTMLSLFLSPAGFELIPFSFGMFFMAFLSAVFVILAACASMFAVVKLKKSIFNRVSICVAAACLLGTVFFHVWHAFAVFYLDSDILERNQIFPANIGATSNSLFRRMGLKRPEVINLQVDRGSFDSPRNPLTFAPGAKKYNIVFILVDGLRGDMVTPEVMPFLSRFARENAYFANHFSNSNCTRNGMFSLFSGVVGTYWHQALKAAKGSVLVDSAVERDYQIGIFFGANLTKPEFDCTIFSKVKGMRLSRGEKTKIGRDESAFRDFKKFILERDKQKPLFSVIMFDALHGYAVPRSFKLPFPDAYTEMNYLILQKDNKAQRQKVFNLMRNATAFADTQIRSAVEVVKKNMDWENTILIISSDHGNSCNEALDNTWGHNSKFVRAQLHVPMVIAGGPVQKGIFNYRTYHIDVVPYLMTQLGCLNPVEDYASGRNIFENTPREMMVLSGYSKRALLFGNDIIYEMYRGGINSSYTADEKETNVKPSSELIRSYLNKISEFSR